MKVQYKIQEVLHTSHKNETWKIFRQTQNKGFPEFVEEFLQF